MQKKAAVIFVIVLIAVLGGFAYAIHIDRTEIEEMHNLEVVTYASSSTPDMFGLGNDSAIDSKSGYKIISLKIKSAKSAGINNATSSGVELKTEIADTQALKNLGLSGRNSIDEDRAMLFVFNDSGYYGFWMKDMKFAIDIIWIDENKKIVHIAPNVAPDTYPESFQSKGLAKYVLEVQAGLTKSKNIKVGDSVEFDLR